MPDDVTTQYVLERVNEAVQLNQELEVYIVANSAAILSLWSDGGRVALSEKIEAIFLKISNIDYEQINIINEQAYTATQILLKTLDICQSLFPKQINENLRNASNELKKKINAYQSKEQVEHKLTEEVVVADVVPEPLKPMKTDDCKREGLNGVASQKNVWMDPVQMMTIIAALSLMVPSTTRVPMVMTFALLSLVMPRINLMSEVPDTFEPLIRTFEEEADAQPQVIELIDNLDQANETYLADGNLDRFQADVDQYMDYFAEQADLKKNASDPWFQKYIIKPFEQFKQRIYELIQSIRRKTPENTGDQLGFFNKGPTEAEQQNVDKNEDVQNKPGG